MTKFQLRDKQECIPTLYLNLQTTEITLKTVQPYSFSKTPIAIHVNLLQFGPSVPFFVFAVLFKPFVNVLSGYFYVSVNLVARSWWLNLAKFHDTAPLEVLQKKSQYKGRCNK